MSVKIVAQNEFKAAVKEIFIEQQGKVLGTLSALTVTPRIYFGQLKAEFSKAAKKPQTIELETYIAADFKKSDAPLRIETPPLYNNADALEQNIKAALQHDSSLRSVLLEALMRAPDHAGKLADNKIIPYTPKPPLRI